jgi:hypothetical protein
MRRKPYLFYNHGGLEAKGIELQYELLQLDPNKLKDLKKKHDTLYRISLILDPELNTSIPRRLRNTLALLDILLMKKANHDRKNPQNIDFSLR